MVIGEDPAVRADDDAGARVRKPRRPWPPWPPCGELLLVADAPPTWMVTTAGATVAAIWIVLDSCALTAAGVECRGRSRHGGRVDGVGGCVRISIRGMCSMTSRQSAASKLSASNGME